MDNHSLNLWYSNKKILVIGGFGFVGSYLINKLREYKANIYVLSRHKYKVDKDITLYIGDISNTEDLSKIITKKFDVIFNCSGISGNFEDNPKKILEMYKTNVRGCTNLLFCTNKFSPLSKIVLIGSKLEYGKAIYLPVDEKHKTSPLTDYGYTKLIATQIANYYHLKYSTKVTILRISNIYGFYKSKYPMQKYNIINNCIQLAVKGKQFHIFGNGNQLRDYLYIEDAIYALLIAGSSDKSNGQIYNIGFGKEITFKKMVLLIANNSKLRIVYKDWPKNYKEKEGGNYISDISKAKFELGWEPKIDFKNGIIESIKNVNNYD